MAWLATRQARPRTDSRTKTKHRKQMQNRVQTACGYDCHWSLTYFQMESKGILFYQSVWNVTTLLHGLIGFLTFLSGKFYLQHSQLNTAMSRLLQCSFCPTDLCKPMETRRTSVCTRWCARSAGNKTSRSCQAIGAAVCILSFTQIFAARF